MPQKSKVKHYLANTKTFLTTNKKLLFRLSIAAAILIISLFIISFISVQIKLLFDTETYIELSPSIASITLDEKIAPTTTFTTTVDHLSVCDIYCTYSLIQANNQTTLYNETLQAPKKKISNLTLPLPEVGAGQLIYNYQVSCETTQKTLCPSKGKTYKKTAFVTVNYPLSKEEVTLQKSLEPQIRANLSLFAQAQIVEEEQQAKIIILEQNTRTNITPNNFTRILLEQLTKDETTLLTKWEEQAFKESQEVVYVFSKTLQEVTKEQEQDEKTIEQELSLLKEKEQLLQGINITTIQEQAPLISIHNEGLYKKLLEQLNNTNTIQETPIHYSAQEQLQEIQELKQTLDEINITHLLLEEEREQEARKLQENYTNQNRTLPPITCENITTIINIIDDYDNIQNMTTNTTSITLFETRYCTEKNESLILQQQPIKFTIITRTINTTTIPKPQAHCTYANTTIPCGEQKQPPILLIHGHSFSKSTSAELAFTRLLTLQDRFTQDDYINAGTLNANVNLTNIPKADWTKNPSPIVIGVTYYYLQHYDLGKLSFTTRKTDRIENYAIRLKEAIDEIKEKTGSEEVILIAHSMGGLVARSYINLFGEEDVNKLIILGTPNNGVEGDIRKYCTVTGAKNECEDMEVGSPFLQNLNREKNTPQTTKVYTIAAIGCPTKNDAGNTEPGDGVILQRSVSLDFAQNYIINGTCTDNLQKDLHMNFVNTNLYPETYEIIKEILQE